MVYGISSKFTEGFTSFTVDDELMIANLKQAVNYSKDNLSIPDASLKLSSVNNQYNNKTPDDEMPITTNEKPFNMPDKIMNPTTTMMASDMVSSNQISKNMGKSNITVPNKLMNNSTTTRFNTSSTMETLPNRELNTKAQNTNTNTNIGKPLASLSNFKNIPKVVDDGEDDGEDGEDGEDSEDDEDGDDNQEVNSNKQLSNNSDDSENMEEGFQGSLVIESRNTRNILLALLLSCIGYLVVYSMTNNFLPLDDISPQMKKFKKLIYGGLFFIISYICLEVF